MRQTERQSRVESRADRFWSAFRFTENGRPKSGFGVYTFSLSLAFAAVYFLCYEGAIRLLSEPLSALPAWQANLLIALPAALLGAALCCLPHRFLSDKRLVFGGHLWLCLYALAVLVIMLALLGFSAAYGAFLVFFGWFVAPPVGLGTLFSALLFRKDRAPAQPAAQPEWRKYVDRH